MLKFQLQVTYTYDLDTTQYPEGTSFEDMARAQGPLVADLLHAAIQEKKPGLKMLMKVVHETPTTVVK